MQKLAQARVLVGVEEEMLVIETNLKY